MSGVSFALWLAALLLIIALGFRATLEASPSKECRAQSSALNSHPMLHSENCSSKASNEFPPYL